MSVEERLRRLEQLVAGGPSRQAEVLSVETLLDLLLCLHLECGATPALRREKNVQEFLERSQPFVSRVRELRLRRDDFDILKVIGRGAFGEVAVVKLRSTERVFAMKILHKWEMIKRADTACFQEERDVLVKGDKHWITNLHYAFQDDKYLYLVMDYYVGGDLLTLLSKFEDRLPEDMARFYLAEMVLAVHAVHQSGYVHRDIKPDNVLIDMDGHIKLADFGSCLRLGSDGMVQSSVAVGTPDYISPEILQAMEDGKGRYGPECDWWSLGVCSYELLFGETPFYAESLLETYSKIMNHKDHLKFPSDITDVSEEAKDLIGRLICERSVRLGQKGIRDFQEHAFFKGVAWDSIRHHSPPHVPEVSSPADTSNFDVDDETLRNSETLPPSSHSSFAGNQLPFVGFTFTSHCALSDRGCLMELSEKEGGSERVETDMPKESVRPQNLAPRPCEPHPELKTLREEVERLQAKLAAAAVQGSEAGKQRTEDEAKTLRRLEGQLKSTREERDSFRTDVAELRQRAEVAAGELREAVAGRRQAQRQAQEAEERQAEAEAHRQRLTRQLRERGQEAEALSAQLDATRQDLRKVERARKELELQCDSSASEISQQKRLRERTEQYCRELEQELDNLKKKPSVGQRSAEPGAGTKQELTRLGVELERKGAEQEAELKNLQRALREKEEQQGVLQSQLSTLTEKLDAAHKQSQQDQEALAELREAAEKEKSSLREESSRLASELEQLSEEVHRLQAANRQLEEECQSLSTRKQSVSHWEEQISDILQWVNDEKESRGYLQALTTRLTEEMEGIKATERTPARQVLLHTPALNTALHCTCTEHCTAPVLNPPSISLLFPPQESQWKARRLQKTEASARLELQSALEAELRAKQSLQEELNTLRAASLNTDNKLQEAEKQKEELRAELEGLKTEIKSHPSSDPRSRESIITLMPLSPVENSSISFSGYLDPLAPDQMAGDLPRVRERSSSSSSSSLGKPDFRVGSSPQQKSPARSPTALQFPASSAGGSSGSPGPKPTPHQFKVKSFSCPMKCNRCTSLLMGLVRQGLQCDACGYACHVTCANSATICPDKSRKPLGVDPVRGTGTAFEGQLSIPKPAGVRRGWQRCIAIISDFRLLLFDSPPTPGVIEVIDIRDPQFSVSSVLAADVIHANKRDVPCIFRVSFSQLAVPPCTQALLLLADSEAERRRWEALLGELQELSVRHSLPPRCALTPREAYDPALPFIRQAQCAAILDRERIALGTEEALYVIDVTNNEIVQLPQCKRVFQIEVLGVAEGVAVLCGRSRGVRVLPWADLSKPDSGGTKLPDVRGVTALAQGGLTQGTQPCLCVAIKRQVLCYRVAPGSLRCTRLCEVTAPAPVQWLGVFGDRLCVGYPSGFSLYPLLQEGPPLALLSPDDPSLLPLPQPPPPDALCAVEIARDEVLLCFTSLGLYVDYKGRRIRHRELMWPSPPSHCCYSAPYLSVYSESGVHVFDVKSMEWVQTLSVRKPRPLNMDGSLTLFSTEPTRLVYLRSDTAEEEFAVPEPQLNSHRQLQRTKTKRKFNFRISEEQRAEQRRVMMRNPSLRSKLISNPTNFSHLVHVGPGEGVQSVQGDPRAVPASAPAPHRPRSATESQRPLSAEMQRLRDLHMKRQSRGSLSDELLTE
ncbi:serine/threonine-protein kinase MRCK alpha isoform X2 [Amia ocellicauda]|uniref:serine/threonine-protein kinase MRCK alpha isoform X2 n=1 Tax=Amia ocellicauda TaxID=2972642 RepID=UPI0034647F20